MGYAQLDATMTKKFQNFLARVFAASRVPRTGWPVRRPSHLMRGRRQVSRQHRFDYLASYVR